MLIQRLSDVSQGILTAAPVYHLLYNNPWILDLWEKIPEAVSILWLQKRERLLGLEVKT